MKTLILAAAIVLALAPKVKAQNYANPYTVIPYTFSVAMWGSQGPAAPGLARNLIPQEPIFGTDASTGMVTTAASLAECKAVRAEVKADLGTLRLVTQCHPTTPVVLEGPVN